MTLFWDDPDDSREVFQVFDGSMPNKQLKMLLGWAALHQEELMENWALAEKKQELFQIDPLK